MKIIITGALGHIGSKLIRELPVAFPGAELILLDNLSAQRYCSLFDLPVEGNYRFLQEDVLRADLTSLFKGAACVVHLAAITNAADSFDNAQQVELVNFDGTERVANACVQTQCPLIFLSTTSVYGTQDQVVDESCPSSDLKPQSPYAESKLRAERLLQSLGEAKALNFIILRLGTIFGTSIGMRFHTAINKFCWQAVTGQPVTVWRTARYQNRPYLDLKDAVAAIRMVIERNLFDRRIYNVVTANASVDEIISIIKQHVSDLVVEYVDSRIMNQLSYNVSNERFSTLGFEFEGNLEEGIAETIELLRGVRSSYQPNPLSVLEQHL
jgi:nucleoside-diphosphate-sugar epimerase